MATKFENWSGTEEAGRKETDAVVEVRTSEASRRDARPVVPKNTETISEEFDRLRAEKLELERKLAGFSQSAMLKEQQRIRREYGANSFNAWVNRKHELEQEKRPLIDRLIEIEKRLNFIKDKAKAQKHERNAQRGIFIQWQQPMLDLLTEIRDELRLLNRRPIDGTQP